MIDPRGLTIKQWCDFMVPELERYGQIPILQDEIEWRQWAQEIIQFPGIAAKNPPQPGNFDSFLLWAERFNMAVIA